MRNADELTTDQAIGLRLKKRRLELGLSQEAVSEKLGVSFQQVQKYETGINRISGSRLLTLARLLNVSTDYFFDGLDTAKPPHPPTEAEKFLATKECVTLVEAMIKLKPAHRRAVVKLACELVEE